MNKMIFTALEKLRINTINTIDLPVDSTSEKNHEGIAPKVRTVTSAKLVRKQ